MKRSGLAASSRNAPNYVVHLTRDSDVYIPLRERVNIGRSWRADLFISLHADSNPDPSVNGLSIYTLSESGSDKEAAALARKENQSDVIAGVDLGRRQLDRRADPDRPGPARHHEPIVTFRRGARFRCSPRTTDILPRQPHRSAAFVVLKAPDVPVRADRTGLSFQRAATPAR